MDSTPFHLASHVALILVPTRELDLQTSAVVLQLGKHLKICCMVSTGGTMVHCTMVVMDEADKKVMDELI